MRIAMLVLGCLVIAAHGSVRAADSVVVNADGSVVVGADPGGDRLLRLGPGGGIQLGSRQLAADTYMGYGTHYRAIMLGSASNVYGAPVTGGVTLALGVDPTTVPGGRFTGDGREIAVRRDFCVITPDAAGADWTCAISFDNDAIISRKTAVIKGVLPGAAAADEVRVGGGEIVAGGTVSSANATVARTTPAGATELVRGDDPRLTPAGAIIMYAMPTPPAGWLACDGATVSRTTYAALFAVIGTTYGAGDGSTTFKLPDLRGEFVRGWDAGRGADPSRPFASAQTDELKSHYHLQGNRLNSYYGYPFGSDGSNTGRASDGTHTGAIPYTSSVGGAETRPRNIALLYCIKH